jgi:valyl-tRNA synthetase
MDKVYDHKKVEKPLYNLWEDKGYFTPGTDKKGNPFTITMPPPNANGELHIGHAMFVTLEDIMIRYHRMKQDPTLWLPGADHAGILTQVVYERELEKQKKTRHQLGREKFFEEAYHFTMKNKKHMEAQLKSLGASCDWSREKFTLDPNISKAVYHTFKLLYDDGLIYRGERIINWCPRCATALSDLEVEHVERADKLWFVKYPVKGSGSVTVATTRPETMLGDTAVAVNPKDKRYEDIIGKTAILPLMNRKIPIISDELVDASFGTGAVKVTPAHDPVDFKIGQKHKLDQAQVIGFENKMTKEAGDYAGLTTKQAREKILEDLEKQALIEKIEDLTHSVGVCERCRSIVEPLVSKQWFVAVSKKGKSGKVFAKDALDAVRGGKVKILPKRFEKVYYNWLENIRDWCISRQIWWGHQIPVWYCGDPNIKRMGFAESVVPQVFKGKTKTYRLRDHSFNIGDKVVFENSGTHQVFGHGIIKEAVRTTVQKLPLNDKAHGATYKKMDELIAAFKRHNPDKEVREDTTAFIYSYELITTGKLDKGCGELIVSPEEPTVCPTCKNKKLMQDQDTLDTWFSSGQWPFTTLGWPKETEDFKYFYPTSVMETGYDILFFWVARMVMFGLYCTDKPPFHTIYLHGLIRDEHGQKMSKSKGNVIDPITVAEKYGADAVRMALVFGTAAGNDANLGEAKIKGMRNFSNKLWNIGRFIIDMKPEKSATSVSELNLKEDDKWIVEELGRIIESTTKNLENYRFSQAAEDLYDFVWHKLADKYIESSKNRREEAQPILEQILQTSLQLLHPFMPFITEDLWQKMKDAGSIEKKEGDLIVSNWPKKV